MLCFVIFLRGVFLYFYLHAKPQKTASQKAMVASLLAEEKYAAAAKERLSPGTNQYRSTAILQETSNQEQGEAIEIAAIEVGVSPRYAYEANRIRKEAPELIQEISEGKTTIPEAVKKISAIRLAESRAVIADAGKA